MASCRCKNSLPGSAGAAAAGSDGLGGQIEVSEVSKLYGAAAFAKTVVQRLLLHHRARQAHRDDRPVGLRQDAR